MRLISGRHFLSLSGFCSRRIRPEPKGTLHDRTDTTQFEKQTLHCSDLASQLFSVIVLLHSALFALVHHISCENSQIRRRLIRLLTKRFDQAVPSLVNFGVTRYRSAVFSDRLLADSLSSICQFSVSATAPVGHVNLIHRSGCSSNLNFSSRCHRVGLRTPTSHGLGRSQRLKTVAA